MNDRIGFLGAGQMAQALAGGFVEAGIFPASAVFASDPSETARQNFSERVPGATVGNSTAQVVAASDIILLAVKPQVMSRLLAELSPLIEEKHLIVSIAAGISTEMIAAELRPGARIIRVMPNTPCLVGQSASGFSPGKNATAEDVQLVEQMFSAVGRAFPLEEKHLDAVTGLAGSGPAFVYLMIEALSDGGVKMGLSREVALQLAAQTVRGAATMVLESGEHPGVLKDRVTSPGGTTIAGLNALERGSVRAALIAAVEAATRRSQELGSEEPDKS